MRSIAQPAALRMVILAICQAVLATPCAAGSSEFWPEVSAFIRLDDRARVYLDAAHAQGKESESMTLDMSAFLDVSIMPILRRQLQTQDWQRSRYLWARAGYTRVEKASAGARQAPEDRLSGAVYAKADLPGEVWLEGRARTDLRWIGGDYSTRYRLRLEATREVVVLEHTVVPYANAECFYDTRYDGWARTLYMLGAEVTVDRQFRFEVYLGRQIDRLPEQQGLTSLGLVAKWYY